MFFAPRTLLASLLVASSSLLTVNAALQVTKPDAQNWWVAKSTNVLEWSCKDTTVETFTILIANSDPKVLTQALAIVAIQNNFDCSKIITQDQANQPAATGYTILLANPLNNTEVYATSEPFEIKPLGSLYPAQASSAIASATNASSAANATSTSTSTKSGAVASAGVKVGLVLAAGVVGVVAGLM